MNEQRTSNQVLTEEQLNDAIAHDIDERQRIEKLTNEQLVDEILNTLPFTISAVGDALVEEACTRLDPNWLAREQSAPLTPADEAMLERCMARFRKRLAQVLDTEVRAGVETTGEQK